MAGINTYTYVENNPVNLVDPLGLWSNGVETGAFSCLGCHNSWFNPSNIIYNAVRPNNMTPIEERQFSRICEKSDNPDPCQALKDAANKAIDAAFPKMEDMLMDKGGMFNGPGWITHAEGLRGRINNINAMITLGQKMGCDMSEQVIRTMQLQVPSSPRSK